MRPYGESNPNFLIESQVSLPLDDRAFIPHHSKSLKKFKKIVTMTMTITITMTNNNDNYGFRFREWDIYCDAREFRVEINRILKDYPGEEKYVLVDQTKRALNSVVLNIAESSSKNTDKERRVYINRAHCSLDEVVACLDCALDSGYIAEVQHQQLLENARSLAKRLRGFNDRLSKSSSFIH